MREEDGFGLVVRERERRRISPRKWPQMVGDDFKRRKRFGSRGQSGYKLAPSEGAVLDIFSKCKNRVHFI